MRISDWSSDVCSSDLNQRLEPSKVIIVPTAPCIEIKDLADPGKSSTFEEQYRNFWYVSISSVEMGRLMWPDYPAFKKMVEAPPALDEETKEIGRAHV